MAIIPMEYWVGPYAELTVNVITRRVDTCPRPDHCPAPELPGVSRPSAFCPTCGIENKARFHEREGPGICAEDILRVTRQALTATDLIARPRVIDGKMRLKIIPNGSRPGSPGWSEWDGEDLDLSDVDATSERKWFKEAYAAELETLEAEFGNIGLKWGLVRCYSYAAVAEETRRHQRTRRGRRNME